MASLRGYVAKHPDNPGALPHQRSAVRSERDWIGLGLAAWNGAEPVWNGQRPWRGRLGEADDRTVPGRWEGDLPIGKDCRSAAGTLVKRTIRYGRGPGVGCCALYRTHIWSSRGPV